MSPLRLLWLYEPSRAEPLQAAYEKDTLEWIASGFSQIFPGRLMVGQRPLEP